MESVFSSFKCRFTVSCSRKEDGNAKTAVNPQVRLLQHTFKNTHLITYLIMTELDEFFVDAKKILKQQYYEELFIGRVLSKFTNLENIVCKQVLADFLTCL